MGYNRVQNIPTPFTREKVDFSIATGPGILLCFFLYFSHTRKSPFSYSDSCLLKFSMPLIFMTFQLFYLSSYSFKYCTKYACTIYTGYAFQYYVALHHPLKHFSLATLHFSIIISYLKLFMISSLIHHLI